MPAQPVTANGPAITDLPAARLGQWLSVQAGIPLAPPISAVLLAGGRSNLTYQLTDSARASWVLRRPPLSGVISSAHDVLREHRIMAALAGSSVPVPAMVAACPDESVIGSPFFVMQYVDGVVLHNQQLAEDELAAPARDRVGYDLVSALAALHSVDPAQVGLSDLGMGASYVHRQLTRWRKQLDRLGVQADDTMCALHERLSAAVPDQTHTTIVHGDFRLGNAIVSRDGAVRAVVDWELATLGDPMADVGYLAAYWGSSDPRVDIPMPVPTRAAGFASLPDVLGCYERLTGRSLADLDYYIAFSLWRLAAILAGVHARARQGAYGPNGNAVAGPDADDRVRRVIAAAEAATTAAGC
jgi:aminoglycoside phosphotransferase (APT) family kinase protein